MFEKKKKTMTTSNTFFDGFAAKKGDGNYRNLFQWFCDKEGDSNNVIAFFYGDSGGVVKKVMATTFFLFFIFLFIWSFWSSSLNLRINNEMVVF
jgi:hypothetical protein